MGKLNRKHRTVLFVDGLALQTKSDYLERVQRLAASVNGSCIKVDIFTVFPEKVSTSGIVSGVSTSASSVDDSNYFNADRLNALGAENGYTQTLISSPTKGGW